MATSSSAARYCDFGEDRISELPDDIILTFLSPMEMKDAAKTSILSKRWRYLWAKKTHLDFNHLCVLPGRDPATCPFTDSEKCKYINWVNQVVDLHCGPCIDTFRVCSDFDIIDALHFDKWVKFALSRKVKNLELNSLMRGIVYTLGFDILKPSVGIGVSGITSLTSLHLNAIDVSGEFIEFLLSKCHHLERLYVSHSTLLVRLKVIGLACKLKHLALRDCFYLKDLEIEAHNLEYFDCIYMDWHPNLVFRSMPMLVEAAFSGACFETPLSIFRQMSCFAAHISKLSLDMRHNNLRAIIPGVIPTFRNLKQLNVVVPYHGEFDIKLLLDACPVLEELKLEFYWYISSLAAESFVLKITDPLNGDDLEEELDYLNLRQTEPNINIHQGLKLVEIIGFGGCSDDVDFITAIIRSAWNLETLVCDPRRCDKMYENYDDEVATARARAYKLAKIIPSKISLVIK